LSQNEELSEVCVVIPAFNEEGAIAETLRSIEEATAQLPAVEVVVVDDGSTDRTAERAVAAGARVISLPENRGYGAAIKAGIAETRGGTIVIIDADGTYPASAIPELLSYAAMYDMVVGARVGADVAIPMVRRPAKWLLGWLASFLAGRKIPDLNSGLRVMRRDVVERFEHLLPSGFSFTTTITLAVLCSDGHVKYHPIDYFERVGESKIRPKHAFEFLMLVLRTVVYFNPLKVFLPLGGIFLVMGTVKFIWDLVIGNLSETALLGFLAGALFWAVGLLSDQIARVGLGGRPQ
jgi:glycosyltransferase involved in cell wall biosynthesis